MAKDPGSRYPSAAEMARDIVNCRDALKSEVAGIFNIRNLFKTLRRLSVIVPGLIGLVAVASLAFMFSSRQAKVRWARGVALPEIRRLIGPTL